MSKEQEERRCPACHRFFKPKGEDPYRCPHCGRLVLDFGKPDPKHTT